MPSDRRVFPRSDVFGALWGALGVHQPVRLVNITTSGALIVTGAPVPVESVHSLRLTVGQLTTIAEGRVRHITPVPTSGRQSRYLIGLEFVAPSIPFLDSIERFVAAVDSRSRS
jgi:hypothetical protein